MLKAEIFEEIRALLKEPQSNSVAAPQTYEDSELIVQVRSALRWAKARGVLTDSVMDSDGAITPEPTDTVGALLALRAASMLLRGDMIQKLNTGELGVYFRAGTDIIDTKTVASSFKSAANMYDSESVVLLTMILSDPDSASGNVFGDSSPSV